MTAAVWLRGIGPATTLVVVAALVAGCETSLCVPNLVPGGRYQADLIERYDDQSQYKYTGDIVVKPGGTSGACAEPDGITPGASLVLHGRGTFVRMNSCSGVTADLDPPPSPLTITGPASNVDLNVQGTASIGTLVFTGNVTFGQCTGTMGISILRGEQAQPDDIFLAPTPGSSPHAVLYRMFAPLDPADTTCPPCYDNFVIQLSKVSGSAP